MTANAKTGHATAIGSSSCRCARQSQLWRVATDEWCGAELISGERRCNRPAQQTRHAAPRSTSQLIIGGSRLISGWHFGRRPVHQAVVAEGLRRLRDTPAGSPLTVPKSRRDGVDRNRESPKTHAATMILVATSVRWCAAIVLMVLPHWRLRFISRKSLEPRAPGS